MAPLSPLMSPVSATTVVNFFNCSSELSLVSDILQIAPVTIQGDIPQLLPCFFPPNELALIIIIEIETFLQVKGYTIQDMLLSGWAWSIIKLTSLSLCDVISDGGVSLSKQQLLVSMWSVQSVSFPGTLFPLATLFTSSWASL